MNTLAEVIQLALTKAEEFKGREASLVVTKLEEAQMWLDRHMNSDGATATPVTELARLQEREEQIKHGYPVRQVDGVTTKFYDKRNGQQIVDTVAIRELMRRLGISSIGISSIGASLVP